jgi:hypothetical protein
MPGIHVIECPSRDPLSSSSANCSLHHIENVEHVHSASYVMEEEPLHTETKHEDYDDDDDRRASGSDKYTPPPPQYDDVRYNDYEEPDAPFVPLASHATAAAYDYENIHVEEPKHEPAAQTSTVTSAAVSTKSESFHSASSATSSSTASSKPVVVGGLEFAGSAKEARERMKKKGNIKQDPSLTLKDKYDILQKL